MKFNFFKSDDAVLIHHFRVPKILFSDPKFNTISAEAKLLYSILLDLTSLSLKNNWKDENNRIYVYCTVENVRKTLNCCSVKATKLFHELENAQLIMRIKQGLNKPSKIYVYNFASEITNNQIIAEDSNMLSESKSQANSYYCKLKRTKSGKIDEYCVNCFNINHCPFPIRDLKRSESLSKDITNPFDLRYIVNEILETNEHYNFLKRCKNGVATHLERLYFQSEVDSGSI